LVAAHDYLQEALDSATALGQRIDIASHLSALGYVSSLAGEDKRAESYFSRSLELIDEYGFHAYRGRLMMYMGIHARDRGRYKTAAGHFKEAIHDELALERSRSVLNTFIEVAELACICKPDDVLLPVLLSYLSKHPLTTESIRIQISRLECKVDPDQELDAPMLQELTLDQIAHRVQSDLLDSIG
jgi:tetratricopeptide (TPR) repeat protein